MHQSLFSVGKILLANNNIEISTSIGEPRSVIVEDKITNANWRACKEQFEDLPFRLEGVEMHTWYGFGEPSVFTSGILWHISWFRENLYAQKEWTWRAVTDGMKLRTYFWIKDGRKFLESILKFADEKKRKEESLYAESKAKQTMEELMSQKISEYGKSSFDLSFTVKDYLAAKIPYYSTIRTLPGVEILKISLFKGNLKFTIRHNGFKAPIAGEFTFDPSTGVISNGESSYPFDKRKGPYVLVNKMFALETGEWILINDLIDELEGIGASESRNRGKYEFRVRNTMSYANEKIEENFGVRDFFQVEDKAYRRRF